VTWTLHSGLVLTLSPEQEINYSYMDAFRVNLGS